MRIEYTETARKQLRKLDRTMQKRILDYMDEVALVENMRGLWRYRIGDYRVICEIQESRIIISVLKIGHRKNIY